MGTQIRQPGIMHGGTYICNKNPAHRLGHFSNEETARKDDIEALIDTAVQEERKRLAITLEAVEWPKKKKDAEYPSMYSYEYVHDGNLDYLCEYVADKSSNYGYNISNDDHQAVITNVIAGLKEGAER